MFHQSTSLSTVSSLQVVLHRWTQCQIYTGEMHLPK